MHPQVHQFKGCNEDDEEPTEMITYNNTSTVEIVEVIPVDGAADDTQDASCLVLQVWRGDRTAVNSAD